MLATGLTWLAGLTFAASLLLLIVCPMLDYFIGPGHLAMNCP